MLLVGILAAWVIGTPWMTTASPMTPLSRYAPLRDGAADLRVKYDANGILQSWTSSNTRVFLSGQVVLGVLREPQHNALKKFLQPNAAGPLSNDRELALLADMQVYRQHSVETNAQGVLTPTNSISFRNPDGDYVVAFYYPATNTDAIFDPPPLVTPGDLSPTRAPWQAAGKLGTLDYKVEGRVLQAGAFQQWQDCIRIGLTFTLSSETFRNVETDSNWYCAGQGNVETVSVDETNAVTTRTVLVSQTGSAVIGQAVANPPTTPVIMASYNAPAPDWLLQPFARLGSLTGTGEMTIPPTWLPNGAMLLTASIDGDLVAYATADAGGWRFHTGGAIFGPPAIDVARGRIYFGSSDKNLYALDARGFFLWAFPTNDNIASRPVIVGNTIIFGSEDRSVYALDADTGKLKWRVQTGGPVVSSPAAMDDVVVIGSDDGGVYGLDTETGVQKWLFTAGAIEAPIVIEQGTAYAASRDGNLYALDVTTGNELWAANISSVLRTAPALTSDAVYVTDGAGNLNVIARDSGKILQRTTEGIFIGTPLVVGDSLFAAAQNGSLYELGVHLERKNEWRSSRGDVTFRFGPVLDGGALWLGDTNGTVWRLASPQDLQALTLQWNDSVGAPPFHQLLLTTTPTGYQNQIVVVDNDNRIYLLDPRNGNATPRGQIPDDTLTAQLDPLVVGDTLLTVVGKTLYATDLRDGSALWQAAGDSSFFPPVATQDTVLWLTQAYGQAGTPITLSARALDTGIERWHQTFNDLPFLGGLAVRGQTVYLSTPASAYNIRTGERLWLAADVSNGIGAPAVSDDGHIVLMAQVTETEDNLTALDASNGKVRWTRPVKGSLSYLEPLQVSGNTLVAPFISPSSASGLGGMVGLDMNTGAVRWTYTPPVPRVGDVTVQGGDVWFMLEDGEVVGLDAQNGTVGAVYRGMQENLNGVGRFQRPLVMNGLVVVTTGTNLWSLERGGVK